MLNVGDSNPVQESPFLRVKEIIMFLPGLKRGREAPHRRQWVVHHAPQNPCLSFIKVKITFVIRMWTIMVKMKQLTINTIGVAGLPCPTELMSLHEEVNNCVEDLSGGADDGDNHKHANDY